MEQEDTQNVREEQNAARPENSGSHAVDLAKQSVEEDQQKPPEKPILQSAGGKFGISKSTIFIIVSLLLIAAVGYFAYSVSGGNVNSFINNLMEKFTGSQNEITPEDETQVPVIVAEQSSDSGMKEYLDVKHEFLLTYPGEATLRLPGENEAFDTYTLIFKGNRQVGAIETEDDLEDGYIVKISVFPKILNRDLENVALQKRNTYIIKCPDTATFSDIENGLISGAEAKIFEITNCGADVKESFAIKGDTLFEIAQIHKGDLGYEQIYKNATQEIIDNFKFTNIISPTPKETWQTFNTRYGFSFKYPQEMDSVCCTVEGPISAGVVKMIVLADPDSVLDVDGKTFNGFGVFYDPNTENLDGQTYLTNQKNLLEENYKVIIGKAPEGREDKITVGGVEATRFRGYAWWGDMIYVPVPGSQTFVVIAKTELNEGELDSVFADFLSTFSFM
jgi:hypothetical protein